MPGAFEFVDFSQQLWLNLDGVSSQHLVDLTRVLTRLLPRPLKVIAPDLVIKSAEQGEFLPENTGGMQLLYLLPAVASFFLQLFKIGFLEIALASIKTGSHVYVSKIGCLCHHEFRAI